MTAVLLNGASSPADPACTLCTEVERQLAARFDTVRSFHLAGYDIGHCMGEFDCFVKTPGRCRIHDEGQEIERAVHDAELVVRVTPLRYGGYAAPLKKAMDRLLPLISPFFREAGGMTHHAMRYEHRARWASVALDESPSMERARLFRAFAETNALNFGSPAWGAAVVGGDRAAWPTAIADGEQTVRLRPGDTLLEAALNAGIAPPFSCCSGGCGACRVHITDHLDHVVLDELNTVTPEARSCGEVPACLVRLTGPCRFCLP